MDVLLVSIFGETTFLKDQDPKRLPAAIQFNDAADLPRTYRLHECIRTAHVGTRFRGEPFQKVDYVDRFYAVLVERFTDVICQHYGIPPKDRTPRWDAVWQAIEQHNIAPLHETPIYSRRS